MRKLRSCSFSTWLIVYVLFTFTFLTSNIEAFDSFLQLPLYGTTRTRPRSKRVLFIGDFGAQGDGVNDDTEAFKDAWEVACSLSGRIRIVLPTEYMFLIHPIEFIGPCRSKVTIQISGTIVAPEDPDAWQDLSHRKWLYFQGVNHLTIEGGGTINGMGQEWWARSCKTNSTNVLPSCSLSLFPLKTDLLGSNLDFKWSYGSRVNMLQRCKYVNVKNLMVLDSQQMHISFTKCLRVVASHLEVIAPACSPNTDGIHISDSKGVEVKDSIIRTGDDCISIVSNSSRIQIKDIICGPGHGISIMQTSAVKVENIAFMHIKGTSATEKAIKFACSNDYPCEGLYLEDIELVSSSGGMTKSFCWAAYGSCSGLVNPPPCFSCSESFIRRTGFCH
ncbi:putative polygalacturonase [Quercus suber]|uniref:Polygalacturonase n=1 Tax=Quercus suber TaxID=58331 RepID=A0AAW0LJV5_QUESU